MWRNNFRVIFKSFEDIPFLGINQYKDFCPFDYVNFWGSNENISFTFAPKLLSAFLSHVMFTEKRKKIIVSFFCKLLRISDT